MEQNTLRAGRICGNPLCGLCHRVCIEVKTVFDGDVDRVPNRGFVAVLTDITPGRIAPFTFDDALSSGPARFENISVIPVEGNCARVAGDVVIPVTVFFTDGGGNRGTGRTHVTIRRETVLRIPRESLHPYAVEATAALASEGGTFINENTVNMLCCSVIVTKITVMSDILVPSYGSAAYPDRFRESASPCRGLLNTPLFPPFE